MTPCCAVYRGCEVLEADLQLSLVARCRVVLELVADGKSVDLAAYDSGWPRQALGKPPLNVGVLQEQMRAMGQDSDLVRVGKRGEERAASVSEQVGGRGAPAGHEIARSLGTHNERPKKALLTSRMPM